MRTNQGVHNFFHNKFVIKGANFHNPNIKIHQLQKVHLNFFKKIKSIKEF